MSDPVQASDPALLRAAQQMLEAGRLVEGALRREALLALEGPSAGADPVVWQEQRLHAYAAADAALERFRLASRAYRPALTALPPEAAPTTALTEAGDVLFPRLAAAGTLDVACHALVDDLAAAGFELPSIYLKAGERLRCQAARGYFQVVDGFGPGTGIIGRVVADGRPVFIPDVREHPEFIAAVPGLISEACAPVVTGGEVIGVVSVESTTQLPPDTMRVLAAAAAALSLKIIDLGGLPQVSLPQRLARLAVEITAEGGVPQIAQRAVEAATDLSGMAGAALVRRHHPDALQVAATHGSLAERVRAWSAEQLQVLASWVGPDTSSHYPGGHITPPGYEFLRQAQIASLSVHPTVVGGVVTGYLMLVHDRPTGHAPEVVDCLELLAAQTASALSSAAVLAELSVRAERDELTGLGNRSAFRGAVTHAAAGDTEHAEKLGVLLIDLDDFKHVNDSLGHHIGDRLLIEVSHAIRRSLRTDDVACRLGGDEFAIVLPSADVATAQSVADRILMSLSELAPIEGANLQTTASIGIVVEDAFTATPSQMLKAADLAMYLAKEQGKGRWAVFEQHLQHSAQQRLAMESDLRTALAAEQLHLVFQPIVDIASGRMTAVEALCRWEHPALGSISPVLFIPLAEQTGLIIELGQWVLQQVCKRLTSWTRAGAEPDLRVTVNVSTRQLDDPTLLATIDACLADGLDPARLILEITESALAADADRSAHALRAIRERGVHLAVDDFGTGYSSLSRLGASPISRLKIDRSFIAAITGPASPAPIVEATMAMATGLGLGVVAEGVETADQLAHLRSLNCPEAQGFLFSRPLSEQALQPLLHGARPWAALVEQADVDALARPVGLATLVEKAFRPEVDVDELLGALLTQACSATGLDLAFLNRLDLRRDELRVVAASPGSEILTRGAAISWSRSICHTLLGDGRARLTDAHSRPETAALGAAIGVRAFLSEPVWGPDGQLWGTLCASSARARALSDADSATMRLLAGLITEKLRSANPSSTASDQPDQRLIVIDDDPVMLQLVEATILTTTGSRLVGTAVNGEQGVALATAQQPDVIVLDFELPDLSAAAVIERIRHSSRRSRIILYSARSDIQAIGQRLGVDRSVYKGDGIERLHEALTVL